jgi:hypothetical protein
MGAHPSPLTLSVQPAATVGSPPVVCGRRRASLWDSHDHFSAMGDDALESQLLFS